VVAWHAIPNPHSAIHRMRVIHKGACALQFCEHSSDEWGAMELDRFLIDLFNNAGVDWHCFDESLTATLKLLQSNLTCVQNVITSLKINVRSTIGSMI
jgi:hypothetical protein